MYDIFLALYEKFITSGGDSLEWCLNFAIGTDYYNLLEQHACQWWTIDNYPVTTDDNVNLVEDVIDACRIRELRSCYHEEGLP